MQRGSSRGGQSRGNAGGGRQQQGGASSRRGGGGARKWSETICRLEQMENGGLEGRARAERGREQLGTCPSESVFINVNEQRAGRGASEWTLSVSERSGVARPSDQPKVGEYGWSYRVSGLFDSDRAGCQGGHCDLRDLDEALADCPSDFVIFQVVDFGQQRGNLPPSALYLAEDAPEDDDKDNCGDSRRDDDRNDRGGSRDNDRPRRGEEANDERPSRRGSRDERSGGKDERSAKGKPQGSYDNDENDPFDE